MTLTEFQRKAIGVPFVPFGRDYDGWDCYGLLVVAYRDVLDVIIPDFTYDSVTNYRQLARLFTARNDSYWRAADGPAAMQAACIYRRGVPIHAGLVVPGRRIMHVEEGIETCVQPVSHFRVEGYYVPSGSSAAPV